MSFKVQAHRSSALKPGTYLRLEDFKEFNIEDTILPVLNAFIPSGTSECGILNEHLARTIQEQVRSWVELSAKRGDL